MDKLANRFLFQQNVHAPEYRVAQLDVLLRALGFKRGLFDEEVGGIPELAQGEQPSQQRKDLATSLTSVCAGKVAQKKYTPWARRMMHSAKAAVKELEVCDARLVSDGKHKAPNFRVAFSPLVRKYLGDSWGAAEEPKGSTWRSLMVKDFWSIVKEDPDGWAE